MPTIKQVFKNVNKHLAENVHRKLALEIFAELTRKTPVDTGRARASWRLTANEIDTSVEPDGVSFSPPSTSIKKGLDLSTTYHITNNLPYIVPLNEGHSSQAGEFFVEKAVSDAVKRVMKK